MVHWDDSSLHTFMRCIQMNEAEQNMHDTNKTKVFTIKCSKSFSYNKALLDKHELHSNMR